jgi:hypothetical protein
VPRVRRGDPEFLQSLSESESHGEHLIVGDANGHGETESSSQEEYQEGCQSCHQEEDHFQVAEEDQDGARQGGSQGGQEETLSVRKRRRDVPFRL